MILIVKSVKIKHQTINEKCTSAGDIFKNIFLFIIFFKSYSQSSKP